MNDATHAPAEKACTGCQIVKPLEDFSLDKRHADGRQSRCKACFNAHKKVYRDADPQRAKRLKRMSYERNRDSILAKQAARRDEVRGGPPTRIFGDVERRFWSYVEKTDSCWLWTGAKDETGYGVFNAGFDSGAAGSTRMAHIWAYERFVGPVPDGLELDHVKANGCTNRNCVNYEFHLEPVTHQENMRRSSATKFSDAQILEGLAMIRAGSSLRGASRALGMDHKTLGRRLRLLHTAGGS